MIQTYKYTNGYYDVDTLMTLRKYKKTKGHALTIHKNGFKKVVRQTFFMAGAAGIAFQRHCRDYIIKYIQEQAQ